MEKTDRKPRREPSHEQRRKPKRSLRTILIGWFILFSVVPLFLLTGYSLAKYERAIDNELVQRLRSSVREFASLVGEYEKYLSLRRAKYQADASLLHYLSTNSIALARPVLEQAMRNSFSSRVSLFDRNNRVVASFTHGAPNGAPLEDRAFEASGVGLPDPDILTLQAKPWLGAVVPGAKGSLDFVMMTRLDAKNGRLAGYVEEVIRVGRSALDGMKKRLDLEVLLFDKQGQLIAASNDDLLLYPKDMFAKTVRGESEAFFPLEMREEPFLFAASTMKWASAEFIVGLGASKQKSKAALRNVTSALFTVVAAMLLVLALMGYFIARIVLRPLSGLVDAIQTMNQGDAAVEIPITTDTEIGALTEAFNEMSQRVSRARAELENKIGELKGAYDELKDTQARLVHTAKMASLGQLVAGVAHELNNPIGFIYSNMEHLRDYSARLLRLIEAAENEPGRLPALKKELEYDYVVQDLPRLIQSCEDGARRTRDIVLGLRNFSRLEEAKLKKVDLREGIDDTLQLLAGELKARIEVHVEFERMPKVLCYASQLNQVFMNILANAAQAIEGEGEIWIRGTVDPTPVPGSKAGRAIVSIRDSGRGMSAETTERIFDPFFTTKIVGQGTGLGLSISYGIVKKHGGDLSVKSEPGKGCEFTIVLPIGGPADVSPDVSPDVSRPGRSA